jgi:4-methyl-5(b-hydroxyethyl)-thiazole monophosphate biosynthesis
LCRAARIPRAAASRATAPPALETPRRHPENFPGASAPILNTFPGAMPTVLVILPEGFEEIEAVTPIDLLRRAGVEVTVAALAGGTLVAGRNGITLRADTTLADTLRAAAAKPAATPRASFSDTDTATTAAAFDLLLLPGGPGVKHLRADPRVAALVRAQAAAGRRLAAICAAPAVLNDAGLLAGRRHTAHFSVAAELPARLPGERVVIDGKIITSRGAGAALDFGLALVAELVSPEKSREIRASICA